MSPRLRDALLRLLPVLAALATGCEEAAATFHGGGPGAFGASCSVTEDCASLLCLEVSPGRGICTSPCRSALQCPAIPGWVCAAPREVADTICACRANSAVEICGDGLDNDCDGKADDCRMCNGIPAPENDPKNCGTCGNACNPAQTCISGDCKCPTATPLACTSICVDPDSDAQNCGSCGHACEPGQACSGGTCACPDSTRPDSCSTGCVSLASDPSNCGSCGTACATGLTCTDGKCVCSDSAHPDLCDGVTCVDLSSDVSNCGACGKACATGQICDAGQCKCPDLLPDLCGDTCVDFASDSAHCGSCTNACATGLTCRAGACGCSDTTLSLCGGLCVDTQTSAANCGACDAACLPGETCSSGICACASGLHCNGACAAAGDTQNCGTCGNACSPSQVCSGGTCACQNTAQTVCGTECADLSSSTNHCGTCTTSCGQNQVCQSGVCKDIVCTASTRTCVSGDVYFCGATGTTLTLADDCTVDEFCSESSGNAQCLPDLCKEGQPLCEGTVLRMCAPDGSRIETGGTDCAATGKACEAGSCRPIVCTPGEESCSGQTARHCNALGTALTTQLCTAAEYCYVSITSQCLPDVCAQGTFICDQNVATNCALDGSGFAGSRTDCSVGKDTCRDGYCWGFDDAPVVMGGAEYVGLPVGAMDPSGNVMLLWAEQAIYGDPAPVFPPKFSRLDAVSGTWSTPAAPTGIPDGAGPAAVVASSVGNFIALWNVGGHLSTSVYVSATSTWTTPLPLDTAPETASYGRLTIDANNVITAGWDQNYKIWVSRRNPSTGAWSAPLALPTVGTALPTEFPALGADSAGNTLVVWAARTAGVEYARFDAQTSAWGASQSAYGPVTGLFRYPNVNVRADGRAIASWYQYGSGMSYSTYNPAAKTWATAAPLASGSFFSPVGLASYKNSNVLAVNTTSAPGVQASWFDLTNGTVAGPTVLFPNTPGGTNEPNQAVAADGSAMVVAAGGGTLVTRWDPKAAQWELPISLQTSGGNGFAIWMDANGSAVIAWHQYAAAPGPGAFEHVAAIRYTKYR